MKTSKQTTDNLQISAQLLAHLAGQYQVDRQQLKAMGLGWLAKRVKCWYECSEKQLRIVLERLLCYGVDPAYDAGETEGADTVDAILARAETAVNAALDRFCAFRTAAWNDRADYTPDIYEHAIKEMEQQAIKIERERNLIKKLGEPGYIGARLDDA